MSELIRFSEALYLALHSLVLLASQDALNVKHMARILDSSEAHLSKIMQQLSRAGLVNSTRGPNGGFVLRKGTRLKSLLDIYQLIEGPLDNGDCPFRKPECPFPSCLFGNKLKEADRGLKEYLLKTTLEQFVADAEWK